ncbi:MAG: SRPBCC family protein [Betaproteobacteria bacterium]|nr:SRPBCC family protein [Betaproteobacteria bacterium]
MQQIILTVNGEKVEALAEPRTHLGDFLREQQRLTGTHLGCEHGVCGACTVLIDGQPARSCISYAVACEGREVRTIEGFGDDAVMNELRAAFNKYHALQCGFCTPGMLIAARDLVLRVPDADEKRIRVEMSGNLCRCTGYMGIVRAVKSVIDARRAVNDPQIEAAPAAAPAAFTPFQAAAPAAPPAVPPTVPPTAAASAAPAPAAPAAAPAAKKPGTVIEDEFTVDHPLARVWEIFADMPAVAACLPGAEISEHTPTSLKGRITTKFGPMRAAFAGTAALERDEAVKSGAIRGNGTDSLSGSRARGDISYRLHDAGGGRTRVTVAIDYSLQGPLAQFSRGGLVKEFVKKMVADFAANLNARLGAPAGSAAAAAPAAQVDAGGFFWTWLWGRIKSLFGAK